MPSKDERISRLENSVSAKDKIVVLQARRIYKLGVEVSSKNRDVVANKISLAELMDKNFSSKGEAEIGKKRIIELEHEIVSKIIMLIRGKRQ